MFPLACIVEGHGEVEAVPILIRRIAAELDPAMALQLNPVFRLSRGRMLKANGLEPIIELAARRVGRRGALLLLLDGDDDCPAELGPVLKDRILRYREDLLVGVVVAKREFEAWFLAAAASLGGARGLASPLKSPEDPESVRGAKEWLTRHMEPGRRYVETMDQPALTARFDLEQARRADSFDKFDREVRGLLVRMRERLRVDG